MIKEFFKKLDTKAGLLQRFAFRNDNMRKKIAFTLAEVLITLGIIGVVAALTIPTLNKHIKQHTASVRLEKMYSELRNAARLYQADTGISIEEFDTSLPQQEFLNKYFKPYLKSAVACSSTSECWQGGKYPKNLKNVNLNNELSGYKLANGGILTIYKHTGGVIFFFDVDGAKGDNKSGHDIFNFYLVNMSTNSVESINHNCLWVFEKYSKSGIYPGGSGNCYLPMTGFTIDELLSTNAENEDHYILDRPCNKEGSGINTLGGDACAVVLFQNNWKFPKNYPW